MTMNAPLTPALNGEILVNVTPHETRVAFVENGVLQEVQIERMRKRGLVGNIYKGTVRRVLPGMQAACIEIGLERTAFLHASDVLCPDSGDGERERGHGRPRYLRNDGTSNSSSISPTISSSRSSRVAMPRARGPRKNDPWRFAHAAVTGIAIHRRRGRSRRPASAAAKPASDPRAAPGPAPTGRWAASPPTPPPLPVSATPAERS